MGSEAQLGKRPLGFSDGPTAADTLGTTPAWRAIDPASLATLPWSSICAISTLTDGESILVGTGWLAGPQTVITAAHVIAGASRGNDGVGFQVRFPGTDDSSMALDAHYHDRYRGDPADLYDPLDIAALRIAHPGLTALSMAGPGLDLTAVDVAGYPEFNNGKLVMDRGKGLRR